MKPLFSYSQPSTLNSRVARQGGFLDAASESSDVVYKKTTYDQISGLNTYVATTIISTVHVEGTDFPFYTREDDTRKVVRREDVRWFESIQSSPIALLEETPLPTELLLMRSFYELPSKHNLWRRNKLQKIFNGFERQIMFNSIPAEEYNQDILGSDGNILREIQRHLIEESTHPVISFDLWTLDEVLNCLNDRVTKFLLDTGIITERILSASGSGVANVDLPSDSIILRRLAWDAQDAVTGLNKLDPHQLDNVSFSWEGESATTPYGFIEEPLDPLSIRLIPSPSGNGTLDIIHVARVGELDEDSSFPLPAMCIPYIKYGVLADLLLKEGDAHDPQRAAYCEARWQEGVELTRLLLGVGGR